MSITDYGAFVELEPGVEGLIHVSEMSWTKKVKHPSKMLEVGQEVECQVLEVDARPSASASASSSSSPIPGPCSPTSTSPATRSSGKVRSITDYGVFVGIEEGVDGMVHKTDLSWTVKVNNPADLYHKGDDVEAIILSINHDEKKVSSRREAALGRSRGATLLDKYKPGAVVDERHGAQRRRLRRLRPHRGGHRGADSERRHHHRRRRSSPATRSRPRSPTWTPWIAASR